MSGLRLEGIRSRNLDTVDLILSPGEVVFVSGPSGSGKSLLLRAIADLDPHEGEVWLDGIPRSSLPAPEWRRRVGLLPAESHWWAETVRDHFSSDGGEYLPRLGFDPDVLDWSVSRLSTGERQRLALARLLDNAPEVLLLDEATANLDNANRDRAETLVDDYRSGRRSAVLWVSHDPEQRRRLGGRRLIIHRGRLEPEP
jgi:ABC-type iron transport system FetAB ATPase subunit